MDKKQQLINAITENPERRLIVMYSFEGNHDYSYTVGEIEKVEVTESTVYDNRIFFNDEYEELLEILEDDFHFDKFGAEIVSDMEAVEIRKLAEAEMKKYEWEPVIVVYVGS